MARVILLRHGETDWNRVMRIQGGASDTPLNDTGRRQAQKAGRALANQQISAVYSSPLKRAAETAGIIAGSIGLEVQTVAGLREIGAGKYEGVLTSDLGMRFSQLISTPDSSGRLPVPEGGESLEQVQARAWAAVSEIASDHRGDVVLVLTHYFVILALICRVLDLPLTSLGRFWMATGSISSIDLGSEVPRLEAFNNIPL